MSEPTPSPVDVTVTHFDDGSALVTIIHRDTATAIETQVSREQRYELADLLLGSNGSGMMRTHRPDKPTPPAPAKAEPEPIL